MNRKKSLLFLLVVLLTSCSNNQNISNNYDSINSSIQSEITSVFSSENESVFSEESSSELSSDNIESSSSEEITSQLLSIRQIKEKAKEFVGKENEVGVYESSIMVNLNLKLLSCLDAITSKIGYGDRYKILMTDGEDYIYLKTNYNNYSYLKNYVENQGVYKVKGNISLYNKEVEITVDEKPSFLENENIDINYNSFVMDSSLEKVYEELNGLKLNCKGVAFSKLVKIEAKCLAKDINNTNLYFGSGEKIINVHGSDKITNKFTVGNSYSLIGALNMHNFRPGLEYVSSTLLDKEIEFKIDNIKSMTASSFYNFKYEVDKDSLYPDYTKLFETPYKVTGYLNSYLKDNKECLVLEDIYNESYYSTYQNASSAKSLFFVNENYVGLTSSTISYCPIYEHLDKGTKLDVIIFPYLWNTQKYPQVYCYNFMIAN